MLCSHLRGGKRKKKEKGKKTQTETKANQTPNLPFTILVWELLIKKDIKQVMLFLL